MAILARFARAPSPLRGTPPFRYRSTGERSVRSRLFGVVPPFRYRSTGERSVRSRPLPPSGYSPVSLPLHGGDPFARAPSPLRGTPPFRYRSTGERSVRSRLFGVVPPFRYRSTGERSVRSRAPSPLRGSPPVSLPLHGGEIRSLFAVQGAVFG